MKDLSWDTHVDKVSKKVPADTGAIKRMKPFVPLSIL